MTKIYSGFFMGFPLHGEVHATWDFNPGGALLPEGIEEDEDVLVHIIGDYKDNDVTAFIVQVETANGIVLEEQPSGTVLHVTTETRNGVSPVESGRRATELGWVPRGDSNPGATFVAKAGFYRAG